MHRPLRQNHRGIGAESLGNAVDVNFAPAADAQDDFVAVVTVGWRGGTGGERLTLDRELIQTLGRAGPSGVVDPGEPGRFGALLFDDVHGISPSGFSLCNRECAATT